MSDPLDLDALEAMLAQATPGPWYARRASDAVRRAELRAAGKCLTCGKRALKGRSYCTAHLAYYRERHRARKAPRTASAASARGTR